MQQKTRKTGVFLSSVHLTSETVYTKQKFFFKSLYHDHPTPPEGGGIGEGVGIERVLTTVTAQTQLIVAVCGGGGGGGEGGREEGGRGPL